MAHDFSSTLPRKASLSNPDVCLIYFIEGAGLVKIGCTTNLTGRLRAIRNSSPVPVVLLGTIPGGTLEEGLLHIRFAGQRRHGEWFEATPDLLGAISQMTA